MKLFRIKKSGQRPRLIATLDLFNNRRSRGESIIAKAIGGDGRCIVLLHDIEEEYLDIMGIEFAAIGFVEFQMEPSGEGALCAIVGDGMKFSVKGVEYRWTNGKWEIKAD